MPCTVTLAVDLPSPPQRLYAMYLNPTVHAAITGVFGYVPPDVLTNDELARLVDTSDAWIRERTGIEQRHVAEEGELTSDLGIAASRQALARGTRSATLLYHAGMIARAGGNIPQARECFTLARSINPHAIPVRWLRWLEAGKSSD